MASKHGRDQAPDFEGFLNNLQDWELSLKDKDKKLKPQSVGKNKLNSSAQRHSVINASQLSTGPGANGKHESGNSKDIGIAREDTKSTAATPSVDTSSTAGRYDFLRNYESISQPPSGFKSEESSVDANSEKELGNEYFKQKKFKEAIDCYSRSIALSPTVVTYANRAMAYIRIKRQDFLLLCLLSLIFVEAEDDCTEALNLDDRYIKAYSRRSTARKELGKLKESIEDAEFALRLEPQNQELKKQYADVKLLYEKEILRKASGALRDSVQGMQNESKTEVQHNGHVQEIQPVSSSSERTRAATIQEDRTKRNDKAGKEELKASVQELAARAASLAKAEAAKNITPPNSAYQFEVSWRGLSGDRALQTRLLKIRSESDPGLYRFEGCILYVLDLLCQMATSPVALPQIFKNALSAPILVDIIRCIASFFSDDINLAVRYLENLTKVSRFDMIIMCLSSTDKTDLCKIWDEVFLNKETPTEFADILGKLRSRYCLKQ
ncbi:hypothetical protein RJ640_013773 [Escallonia rubra]|uniref:RNA-polymerase II-associated protein 3-like C-terminal domain-containing protein n=1 Tax=Escallonia rubra TaxID=112253 RepID=A0AA88QRX9_9ASTE|nr:hypothetical protein RJ640_013773 [Escallonia rubra]